VPTAIDPRTALELALLAAAAGLMLFISIALARRGHRAAVKRAAAGEGRRTSRKDAGPGGPQDDGLRRQLAEISQRLATLESGMTQVVDAIPHTVQGVGVIRYNPFPDMGGNMSFSLALLDGRANGVVISVLNDRNGSRVYGKAVESGISTHPLSDEEQKALALARGSR
jgi:uncharacterized protein DUF4446